MIRAAIFDVFGTVVDWRTGVANVMEEAFALKGIVHDAESFADAWRAEYQPAMEQIRSDNRGYVALDLLHLENLQRVLCARGMAGTFTEEECLMLNKAWEKLPPWPDSRQGLRSIRAKMPVATCSNGSIALMVALARFGDLDWDCILGAEIAQGYKPEAKVYLGAAAALQLAPDEVLMVAAHNADLVAARAAGLQTAFIPRPDEKGPGLGEAEPTDDWDIVAADMIDLAERLSP